MVALFLDGGVGGRHADVLVKPAAQARAGAEGGHLAAVDQNHQPLALAQGGGLGRFKRSVDFRFQFVRLRLFAENLRQRVDALFRTVFQVRGVGGHFDGGGNPAQLVERFGRAAADDDKLRLVGVQRLIVRFEQRSRRFGLLEIGVEIRQQVFVDGHACRHAQLV